GVKAVLAKSFARIHKANLINSGILPLNFRNEVDYERINEFDELEFKDLQKNIKLKVLEVLNKTQNYSFKVDFVGSDKDIETLLYGGTINRIKEENNVL
ncbi:MAG: aconitate hydratase, partial [Sphaerochaetaceae bacterium]|nr:aconitate hydratase [Sphaerochaetaceae bacterium]